MHLYISPANPSIMALSRDQVSSIADACVSQLLSLINDESGWTELDPEDGVRRSMRSLPNDKQLMRGIGTIPFPVEEVSAFLMDNTTKPLYDEMLVEGFPLCEFDSTLKVRYDRFKAMWPVSDRDFVYVFKAIQREDGILLVGKSVDFGVPEREDVVRGELVASGSYLKRAGERVTEMTYLVCADPKGSIPQVVVDFIGQKQTSNVRKIREAMNKRAGVSS
jgi:hypothetical protein